MGLGQKANRTNKLIIAREGNPSLMKAFLKSHRGSERKRFLGVIGSYLIEVLDDDPVISRILSKSKYKHYPSNDSYLSGPTKRMILKTFSNDALIILGTRQGTQKNNICKRLFFINNSDIPSEVLLRDSRTLAEDRWSKILF